jgi:hypothetical protein
VPASDQPGDAEREQDEREDRQQSGKDRTNQLAVGALLLHRSQAGDRRRDPF